MRKWEDIDKHQTVATKEELSIIDTLSFLEVQRIKQGISQTEFAKKIGMAQPQLAKIENLDSIPTLPTLNKYAAGLGLQIKLSISPLMEAK
ncbi:helix-turn-helix domain-containing protein [Limosilactobacillus reuteri]|uniref:helix-turn-helix domain-containing protein n=1 Tax=Limosilactobacillus reuteri TaxID=1598 RepID=UPI00104AD058|nr:helix-turn-helix transcriptional regulator [Limosilactobacillus reuteri]